MKNYRAQTPQNLALTKILQKFRKTSAPLENGMAFSSQGKVTELWADWKSQGKSHKILENSGNLRQKLFIIFQ